VEAGGSSKWRISDGPDENPSIAVSAQLTRVFAAVFVVRGALASQPCTVGRAYDSRASPHLPTFGAQPHDALSCSLRDATHPQLIRVDRFISFPRSSVETIGMSARRMHFHAEHGNETIRQRVVRFIRVARRCVRSAAGWISVSRRSRRAIPWPSM